VSTIDGSPDTASLYVWMTKGPDGEDVIVVRRDAKVTGNVPIASPDMDTALRLEPLARWFADSPVHLATFGLKAARAG
jgi:hypothetical protein